MKYRTLGRTGLKVSPLCLGAMMFGEWGNADHDDSSSIIRAAIDAGINFIDTADVYSGGESEQIVGEAIKGRRDDLVIATKVHGAMGSDPNRAGNSRRWIIRACEESLRRLGTDYIDLYQIHRPDPSTDIEETLGALSDLVHQGKVRYLGSSTFPPSAVVEAQWAAERRRSERFVCEQPPYSILARGIESELLPTCDRYGMGVIAWSPLAGGWLSGKWRVGTEGLTSRRAARIPDRYDLSKPENQAKLRAAEALAMLAEKSGMSLVHMALAFVVNHPSVTSAIVGPRTMEHLEGQLGATDVVLGEDLLDAIDRVVRPGTNFSWADAGYVPPAVASAWRRRRARH
ncbi:MAG: aldo/keto reductase [Acidimicrobiia bacterium]|nr:aldo/keto reductase [Acidimicrobiia bacterium]